MNKDGKDNKESKDIDQLLNNLLGHIDEQEQKEAQRTAFVNTSSASDEAFRRVEEIAQDVEQDQSWKVPVEVPRPPIPPAPRHEPVVVPPPVSHFSDGRSQNPAVRMRDRLDEGKLPRTSEQGTTPVFRSFDSIPDPPKRVISPVDVSDVIPSPFPTKSEPKPENPEERKEIVRSRAEMIREQLRKRRAEEASEQDEKHFVPPAPPIKTENSPNSDNAPKEKKEVPFPPKKTKVKEKSPEKKPSLFQKLFNKKEKEPSVQESAPETVNESSASLDELTHELQSIFEEDVPETAPQFVTPEIAPSPQPELESEPIPQPQSLVSSFGFDDDYEEDFDEDDFDEEDYEEEDDFGEDDFEEEDEDVEEDEDDFPVVRNIAPEVTDVQQEPAKKSEPMIPVPPPVQLSEDFVPEPPSSKKEHRLNHLDAPEPQKKLSAFSRLRSKKQQPEIAPEPEIIQPPIPQNEPAPVEEEESSAPAPQEVDTPVDWKSLSGVEVPLESRHGIPEIETDEPIQLYTSEESRTAVMVTDLDPLPLPQELLGQNQNQVLPESESPQPVPDFTEKLSQEFDSPEIAENEPVDEIPTIENAPAIDDVPEIEEPQETESEYEEMEEEETDESEPLQMENIPDPPSVIWQHMTGVKVESLLPEGDSIPDPPSVKKKHKKRMS